MCMARVPARGGLAAINPAPTVAVPASRLFFINERRLVGRCNLSGLRSFETVFSLFRIIRWRYIRDIIAPLTD